MLEVMRKDGRGGPFPRKVHSVRVAKGETVFLLYIKDHWEWVSASNWCPMGYNQPGPQAPGLIRNVA